MLSLNTAGGYPEEQSAYINRVKTILFKKYPERPKACVTTFGCQQNVCDSEKIKGMLIAMGYDITEDTENAKLIIFNTCAVREHAEDRVYGNVGAVKRLKRADRDVIVAVCGCMAQQQSVADKFRESYPYVDIVFGTAMLYRLPEFVYRVLENHKRVYELSLENTDIVEDIPTVRDGRLKAFIPIMYGCDNFCTYCIVPYVRGRERSREPEQILSEVKSAVEGGYKEIMLLGQNVNSYGKGLSRNINFSGLIRMINGIKGEFRIRFMTSHPKDCTKELIDTIAECEKVERHLHLPFQSGSDRVLKAMNRRYDSKSYLELINYAKKKIPDVTFTSDIIVGFPGETYEDFKKTVELVKNVRFMSLFTFIYSKRPHTPAAVMEDKVTRKEKGVWFDELLKAQEPIGREIETSFEGKTLRVLIEEKGREEGFLSGKLSNGISVELKGDEKLIGSFADVKITGYQNGVTAELV